MELGVSAWLSCVTFSSSMTSFYGHHPSSSSSFDFLCILHVFLFLYLDMLVMVGIPTPSRGSFYSSTQTGVLFLSPQVNDGAWIKFVVIKAREVS